LGKLDFKKSESTLSSKAPMGGGDVKKIKHLLKVITCAQVSPVTRKEDTSEKIKGESRPKSTLT